MITAVNLHWNYFYWNDSQWHKKIFDYQELIIIHLNVVESAFKLILAKNEIINMDSYNARNTRSRFD